MKKQLVIASALMLALAGPLAGCSSSDASAPAAEAETTEAAESSDAAADSDFDAVAYYYGTWRGSVETTGETIYGTAGGSEQMIAMCKKGQSLNSHCDIDEFPSEQGAGPRWRARAFFAARAARPTS